MHCIIAEPFPPEVSSPVKGPGQVFGSVSVGQRRVFLLQEGVLVADGVGHRLLIVDVQLTPEGSDQKHLQKEIYIVPQQRMPEFT